MNIDVYIYNNVNTPSSRLRWINYKQQFEDDSIKLEIFNINDFIKRRYLLIKPFRKADVIVIQKSILPMYILKSLRRKCGTLIYDIDDAIWLNHSKNYKIKKKQKIQNKIHKYTLFNSLRLYDRIIVSNYYLKNHLLRFNKNIIIIPTSPSDNDFDITSIEELPNKFIVGWTGTKENLVYLREIEKYLASFFIRNKSAYLLVISDGEYITDNNDFNRKIINIKWNVKTERSYIERFNIGIMPLIKDEWCKGKAAFKLIYYMKNSIATVATDWGFQREFIIHSENGFLVDNSKEWDKVLQNLYEDKEKRELIGKNGYFTYKEKFSPQVIYSEIRKVVTK
jgi:glycosyltransferase involved in cell wall biosynthesis